MRPSSAGDPSRSEGLRHPSAGAYPAAALPLSIRSAKWVCMVSSRPRTTDMGFIFKTHYDQDIAIVKHGGQTFWYALLMAVMLVAPWLVGDYWMTQLSFILIYSIAGLGLMVLAG